MSPSCRVGPARGSSRPSPARWPGPRGGQTARNEPSYSPCDIGLGAEPVIKLDEPPGEARIIHYVDGILMPPAIISKEPACGSDPVGRNAQCEEFQDAV